jgi:hypothetical protein
LYSLEYIALTILTLHGLTPIAMKINPIDSTSMQTM